MRPLPFEYAVRNLGRAPTRLALSVGSSALVVLLILAAGGFVRGMSAALRSTGGEHNFILMGTGSEDSVERSEIEAGAPGVVAASIPGLRSRAGVPFVSPEVHAMLPAAVAPGAPGRQVMLRGVTPAAALVHEPVMLTEGRWPTPGRNELIAGRMAASVMAVAPSDLAVGRTITIDKQAWTVVGRFGAPGTVVEAELWLPLTDLMTATKRDTVSCIILTIDPYNESTGEGAEPADIAAFALGRPDLELVAMPEREYYARLASFFGPIRAVAWITAGLIAFGGLLGGLNTMYAAFASRIRELGTLQSLGFRRLALAWSMIQESTLATAAGGLIACLVGITLLDGLAVRFSMGAFGLLIDQSVVGTGLAAGLLLGIVGAIPPAIRCLRPAIPVALKAF